MEQRTPLMAVKLWGIIRAILYMTKKGLSKNIPWCEIHMMLKRSTKLAGKAIQNLLLDHQTLSAVLTCRPNDIHSTFIAPREYEFSCSNTPLFHPKRKNNRQCYYIRNHPNGRNKVQYVFFITILVLLFILFYNELLSTNKLEFLKKNPSQYNCYILE